MIEVLAIFNLKMYTETQSIDERSYIASLLQTKIILEKAFLEKAF